MATARMVLAGEQLATWRSRTLGRRKSGRWVAYSSSYRSGRAPFDAPNIAGLAHKICCGLAPQVTSGYSDFVRCLRSELLDRYPARAQRGDNSIEVIQEVVSRC